jgi:hypothetical protein
VHLFCGLALLAVLAPAGAADPPLEVRFGGSNHVTAAAGEVLVRAVTVSNPGTRAVSYALALELPPGWRQVSGSGGGTVEAGSRGTAILAIGIPQDAAAGRYEIEMLATAAGGAAIGSRIEVEIPPRAGVSVRLVEAPPLASMMDGFVARFEVRNSGNAASGWLLRALTDDAFEAVLSEQSLALGPGAAREIEVAVRPRAPLADARTVYVQLVATDASGASGRATAMTRVAPLGSAVQPVDYYHGNIRLSTVAAGDQLASRLQLASNHGGRHPLAFDVRLPQIGDDRLRTWDHYRLSYESEEFDGVLGDHIYELTPLLASPTQAFGVQAFGSEGRLRVGGFAAQSRHRLQPEARHGMQVGYGTAGTRLAASYMTLGGPASGVVGSVRATVAPAPLLMLDAEASAGTARAHRLVARGRTQSLDYRAEWTRASDDFPGRARGQNRRLATATFRPTALLSFDATLRDSEARLGRDGRFTQLIRTHGTGARIASRGRRAHSLRLGLSRQEVATDSPSSQQSTRSDQLELRAATSVLPVRLRLDATAGRFEHATRASAFRQGHLQVEFAAGWVEAAVQGGYQRGPSFMHPFAEERWAASASTRLAPRGTLLLGADVSWAHERGPLAMTYLTAAAQATFRSRSGAETSAQLIYANLGHGMSAAPVQVRLSYAVPFRVPLPAASRQRVAGRVLDHRGAPLADVLVHLGRQSVLTSSDGAFSFARESHVREYLTIDRGSLGVGMVALQELPIRVDPGEEMGPITIAVAPAGRLHGVVVLGDEAGVPPAVVVEVDDGVQRVRAVTDAAGRFQFRDLRPGTWTVRILTESLRPDVETDRDAVTLQAGPGDQQHVRFQLRQRERPVRIIQTGALQLRRGTP